MVASRRVPGGGTVDDRGLGPSQPVTSLSRHPGDAKDLPSMSRAPTDASVVSVRDVLVIPTTYIEGDYIDAPPAGPATASRGWKSPCTSRGWRPRNVKWFREDFRADRAQGQDRGAGRLLGPVLREQETGRPGRPRGQGRVQAQPEAFEGQHYARRQARRRQDHQDDDTPGSGAPPLPPVRSPPRQPSRPRSARASTRPSDDAPRPA
jgi:hypothetical protein